MAIAASAEFNLVDYNRTAGVRTEDAGGSNVSPFDHLKPDVQAALIARVQSAIVASYFTAGSIDGSSRPWEPYLTNKLLDLEDYSTSAPSSKGLTDGTWVPSDSAGKFIVTLSYGGGTYYYARYAVNESGPRAILKLEWKLGSYPDSISSNAATYIERKNIYLGLDAQQLGLIPP